LNSEPYQQIKFTVVSNASGMDMTERMANFPLADVAHRCALLLDTVTWLCCRLRAVFMHNSTVAGTILISTSDRYAEGKINT
jgi:hypothetical protein